MNSDYTFLPDAPPHCMADYVSVATCRCGVQFASQSELHTFAQLDEHIADCEAAPNDKT